MSTSDYSRQLSLIKAPLFFWIYFGSLCGFIFIFLLYLLIMADAYIDKEGYVRSEIQSFTTDTNF